MRKVFLLCIVFTISHFSYSQSGWTQPKGKYYVKLSGETNSSNEFYNSLGATEKNSDINITMLSTYFEYGITDKWTILGFLPFGTDISADDTEGLNDITPDATFNFLGDLEVGMKRHLFNFKFLSTALTARIRLPLGGGEFAQMLTLSSGISIYNSSTLSIYGNIYGGVNNRGRRFSDEYRYGTELGLGYKKRFWLIFKQNSIQSFENSNEINDELAFQLFGNNFENESYTIETALFIGKNYGITASYTDIYNGQLALNGPTYNAGIFWNLK